MADNIFTSEQQQQMAELFTAFTGLNREIDPLIRAKQEEAKRSKEAADALKLLGKQLGNSVLDYGKALGSAGEGFGKFGGAVTGATSAIGDWASKLGIAGTVIGGFIKIFGEIAAKSLKQNDDLMKSYQNLSDMGSVAAGGFETLRDQLHSIGLMAEEAEKFERVLKPITSELAKFGGSVSQGREQLTGVISGLIGPNNEMEKYLARLGYSTQDIREGAADFVQRQARMGLAQGKSQDQLVKESFKYMTTLKELQELTGMSRDEAQKSLDMQLADARMNIYLGELSAKGRDEEAKNLQLYIASYEKTFGKQAASGLKELIYNEGRIVGQLSAQAFQSTRGQVYKDAMTASREGTPVFLKMLKSTGAAMDVNVKQFRNALMVSGEEMQDVTGNFEAINGSMAIRNTSEKEYQKQLEEMKKTGEKGSDRQNKNIENEQKARALRIAGDKAVYEVGDLTVGLFTKLNEVMFGFGKTLAKVADFMSGIIPGMEQTNFSALFRDASDNAKDLDAAKREQLKLQEEIAATKKQIEEAEKGKVDYAKQIRDKQEEIKQLNQAYRTEKDVDKKKELYTKEVDEKRKLLELENLARQSGRAKDGGVDSKVSLELRQKKLIELKERLANDEKKILELEKEKEKLAPGASAKNVAAMAAPGPAASATPAGGASPIAIKATPEDKIKFGSDSGSKTNFEKLDPKFKDRVVAAAEEFNQMTGKKLEINSAKRDSADQERIYQESVKAGRPGIGPSGMPIAKPGTSKHEKGVAVDIQNYKDPDAVAAMNKQGLFQTVPKDPVHFEIPKAKNGLGLSGPMSGYPIIAHGDESVWPDKELRDTLRQVQQTSLSQYKDELMGALGLKSKNLDLANENIMQSMPDMKGIIDALKQELPNLTQTAEPTTTTADSIVAEVMSVLSEKLDALIDEHRKSNDIQDQILTYTRA